MAGIFDDMVVRVRPVIDSTVCDVCDGTVLHYGPVEDFDPEHTYAPVDQSGLCHRHALRA